MPQRVGTVGLQVSTSSFDDYQNVGSHLHTCCSKVMNPPSVNSTVTVGGVWHYDSFLASARHSLVLSSQRKCDDQPLRVAVKLQGAPWNPSHLELQLIFRDVRKDITPAGKTKGSAEQ